jgi:hypothetical protein
MHFEVKLIGAVRRRRILLTFNNRSGSDTPSNDEYRVQPSINRYIVSYITLCYIYLGTHNRKSTMDIETTTIAIPDHITEIWQKIVDVIAEILATPSVMINRLAPPELEIFRSNIGDKNPFPLGTRMPMEGIYCTYVALRKQHLEVTDARNDTQWADSPTAKAGIVAYTGYPIVWPDGSVFGTLCTIDTKENYWDKRHNNLLLTFKNAIEAHLSLIASLQKLEHNNQKVEKALQEVCTLQGLLPICTSCKKIRDDHGYWTKLEAYFSEHAQVEFTHGICPECMNKLYPEFNERKRNVTNRIHP